MRRETKESKMTGADSDSFQRRSDAPHGTRSSSALRETDATPRCPPADMRRHILPVAEAARYIVWKRAIHESPRGPILSARTDGFRAALRFYPEPLGGLSLQGCVKFLRTRATKKNGYRIRPSCRDKIKNFLFVESPLTRYAGALPRGEP